MIRCRQPDDAAIRIYLARVREEPFSYPCVGCTRNGPPLTTPGWNIDQQRVRLGQGEATFRAACEAFTRWRMYPPEITKLCWPEQGIHVGITVGVLYRAWSLVWLLFAARIVYVLRGEIERDGRTIEQFGFANGTLPDHPERGEERFLVEWDRSDDSVWYDLLTVSQPAHWLTRLGYPIGRMEQARFRRLSAEAMQREVREH